MFGATSSCKPCAASSVVLPMRQCGPLKQVDCYPEDVTARLRKPLERGVVASMAVCWSFGLLVSGCSDVLESPKGDSFGGTCRDHIIAEEVLSSAMCHTRVTEDSLLLD